MKCDIIQRTCSIGILETSVQSSGMVYCSSVKKTLMRLQLIVNSMMILLFNDWIQCWLLNCSLIFYSYHCSMLVLFSLARPPLPCPSYREGLMTWRHHNAATVSLVHYVIGFVHCAWHTHTHHTHIAWCDKPNSIQLVRMSNCRQVSAWTSDLLSVLPGGSGLISLQLSSVVCPTLFNRAIIRHPVLPNNHQVLLSSVGYCLHLLLLHRSLFYSTGHSNLLHCSVLYVYDKNYTLKLSLISYEYLMPFFICILHPFLPLGWR